MGDGSQSDRAVKCLTSLSHFTARPGPAEGLDMAKQIENQTTRANYPLSPFGPHVGTRKIVMTYGGPTVDTDDIPPVRGCSFDDPLSDGDKDLLCRMALARVDSGGRFAVDYAALRAHLRTVCGVRDTDLHGLAWATVMRILRPAATPQPQATESQMSGEARALAILTDHPDWTDKRIAEEAGVHVKTLHRYARFRTARRMVRDSGRADLPRGFKTEDGDIEAYE